MVMISIARMYSMTLRILLRRMYSMTLLILVASSWRLLAAAAEPDSLCYLEDGGSTLRCSEIPPLPHISPWVHLSPELVFTELILQILYWIYEIAVHSRIFTVYWIYPQIQSWEIYIIYFWREIWVVSSLLDC
jgi:hypothetical protein